MTIDNFSIGKMWTILSILETNNLSMQICIDLYAPNQSH